MLNKLSTKLGIVLGVLFLIFVVLTIKISHDMTAVKFYTRYFQEISYPLSEQAGEALHSFEVQLHLYESASQSEETYFLERAAQTGERVAAMLSSMKLITSENAPPPRLFSSREPIRPLMVSIHEETPKIDELINELDLFNRDAYSIYLSLIKDENMGGSYVEVLQILERASSLKNQFVDITERLKHNNSTLLSFIHETAVTQEGSTFSLLVVMLILTLVGIGMMLHKFFVLPIQKLRNALARISEGSLKERVEIHSNDEIYELGDTFNSILDRVERVCKNMKESVHQLSINLSNTGQINRSYYHNANILNEMSAALNKNTLHVEVPSLNAASQESQELHQHVAAVNALLKKAAFLLKQFPERHTSLFQSIEGTHRAEFEILQKVIERLTFDLQKIEVRVQVLSEEIAGVMHAEEENGSVRCVLENYKDLEATASTLQKQFADLKMTGLRIQDNTKQLEIVQAEFEHQSKELSSLFGWDSPR